MSTENVNNIEEEDMMPQPKVRSYQQMVILKPKFNKMLEESIGNLGYNQPIGTVERNFPTNAIFKMIEEKKGKFLPQELNQIISMISLAPYNVIKNFMAAVEDKESQKELWTIEEG